MSSDTAMRNLQKAVEGNARYTERLAKAIEHQNELTIEKERYHREVQERAEARLEESREAFRLAIEETNTPIVLPTPSPKLTPETWELTKGWSDDGPIVVIGPECFSDKMGNTISWKGANFYRACSDQVKAEDPSDLDTAWSLCVLPLGHESRMCVDWDGNFREQGK